VLAVMEGAGYSMGYLDTCPWFSPYRAAQVQWPTRCRLPEDSIDGGGVRRRVPGESVVTVSSRSFSASLAINVNIARHRSV